MDFEALDVGPAPQLGRDVYERRRGRLLDTLGDDTLVVATHPEAVFSNDVHHVFRPHSDLWYLTGFAEPGAVLVLGGGKATMFVRPRKKEAEIWTGRRLGVERAVDVLGIDAAHSADELGTRLPGLLSGRVHAIVEHEPDVAETVGHAAAEVLSGADLVHEMRLRKDAQELTMLQKAADVACAAHEEARQAARPGANEYEVEAAFLAGVRRRGSTGPGYPPIVGAGANATILHYVDNRAPITDGMVLIDAGCEWGYYNSDITRTWAVGDVPRLARDLHALVLAAHQAALAEVRPGRPFRAPHDAAVKTLVEGLVDMNLLSGEKDALLKNEAHRGWFMHGTSHYLGLDVHDVGRHKEGDRSRVLEEGMVLTVEPGLYFNPDFAACPPGTEGIGIRIEDDVAVTADGPRVLTASLPREAA